MKMLKLSVLLILVGVAYCVPVQTMRDQELAENYLKRFYGLQEEGGARARRSVSDFSVKLAEMQRFSGLAVTGRLDEATLNAMKAPRCGNPDVRPLGYKVTGPHLKWLRNNITYSIENYTPDLPREQVDASIERALQLWANVTPLRFSRVYGETADIRISFTQLDHGDGSPFYRPDTTLAHAFGPGADFGGDIHFNEDKTFTASKQDYNLFLVAVHEIGHSLGLDHSSDRGAVMFSDYTPRENPDAFTLTRDDIIGVQAIYGSNHDELNTLPPPTPNVCDPTLVLDAVTTLRGEIMFFKDIFFWRTASMFSTPEQHSIRNLWPDIPNNIDAAYESTHKDRVYVFKGQKVWALNGYDVVSGYPRSLSSLGLPSTLKKIDAALYDEEAGKVLLFTGKKYYSYDEDKGTVDSHTPRWVLKKFPGLQGKITAAVQLQGFAYIYSGTTMYEYDLYSGRQFRTLGNNYFLQCNE